MQLTYFIVPFILFICGLIISTGKASFLIAGHNSSSKIAKTKINEKALNNFMSKFLFVLGAIQMIISIAKITKINNLGLISALVNVIFIVFIILGIININTNKKFKK